MNIGSGFPMFETFMNIKRSNLNLILNSNFVLQQEEFQRRQQAHRAEEHQHQQFNVQPNGGYMPMHTSPPGVMHPMHRQQVII